MRRSGNGALNSAENSPIAFGDEHLAVATNGASMKLPPASPGRSIGCGVRSTRTASFSMFSSGAGTTRRPPNAYSESSSRSRVEPPRVLVTDKLKSYIAAKREIMRGVEHRQHKGPNNRAENSHQPIRRRERIMKWFKSPRQVQRFFSVHDQVANLFPRRSDTIPTQTSGPAARRLSPLGPTYRRCRGCIIMRIAWHRSAHSAFHQSADLKLTVPPQRSVLAAAVSTDPTSVRFHQPPPKA
jgi:hypothetical protein